VSREAKMQEDLWGEEVEIPQNPKRRTLQSQAKPTALKLNSDDCIFFGHTWQIAGMLGEKQCTVCGERGYCPVCSPIAPKGANPYFCTRHTQKEIKVVS
jgi:hypothetical protein